MQEKALRVVVLETEKKKVDEQVTPLSVLANIYTPLDSSPFSTRRAGDPPVLY